MINQEAFSSPFKVAETGRVAEAFGERVAVDFQFCDLNKSIAIGLIKEILID